MEQRNLANKFAQLRLPRVLTGQGTPNTDRLLRFRPSGHTMDQLVQDFNTALDETAGSNSSSRSTTSRRKAWKRRCKSTSNLLLAGQNMSDDSSSSVDNVGLLSRDRGTSSLQFSDSDIEVGPGMETELVRSGKIRQSRLQEYRTKRGGVDHLGIESDSFTENISPFKEFRVNTKRKRKFKRMAVDPSVEHGVPSITLRAAQGHAGHSGVAVKRKKVRSRSGNETRSGGKKGTVGITPGKRKRSAREKSVESGEILSSGRSRTTSLGEEGMSSMEKMDMEEVGSSSSLSSSEWEDVHSDGSPEGEADDEQSDWPGPEPGMSVMQLTDDEIDPEISFSQLMTGPPRKASGRVIRAGSRRLKGQIVSHTGLYSTIPAYGEQVSRFMQDTSSLTLRLPAIKSTDRNMILSLASLYSLSWSPEGQNILVLTKTGQTVKPAAVQSEFVVPGIPAKVGGLRERKATDTKRQRRTPPPPLPIVGPATASGKGERHLSGSKQRNKNSSGSKSN
eukprot:GFUD01038999.1.p1 GENE.GFUD01038999.1~~GFUD01038999.1.p1  ORF type:complete len:505 (-),score=210.55 GFUD01038999.1:133-1647(-)